MLITVGMEAERRELGSPAMDASRREVGRRWCVPDDSQQHCLVRSRVSSFVCGSRSSFAPLSLGVSLFPISLLGHETFRSFLQGDGASITLLHPPWNWPFPLGLFSTSLGSAFDSFMKTPTFFFGWHIGL